MLEVGVGGGSLAVWLAQQGAEVVGIDVSPGILGVAAKRARLNGVAERTTFVHAPIETFDPRSAGLAYAQFDAVIGNNVVHHFDRDLALANLGRLLAPGAVAVFCEPVLFLPEIARTVRNSRLVARRFPLHTHSPDERSLDRGRLRHHAALVPARRRGHRTSSSAGCRTSSSCPTAPGTGWPPSTEVVLTPPPVHRPGSAGSP